MLVTRQKRVSRQTGLLRDSNSRQQLFIQTFPRFLVPFATTHEDGKSELLGMRARSVKGLPACPGDDRRDWPDGSDLGSVRPDVDECDANDLSALDVHRRKTDACFGDAAAKNNKSNRLFANQDKFAILDPHVRR